MMTLALLLTAIVMSAQVASVKIAPKYQKGDNMLYRSVGTMTVGGEIVNLTALNRYYIAEANKDGYVIETVLEKMDNDAKDLTGKILQLTQGGLKGVKTVFTADADGKITGIKNFDEVREQATKMVEELMKALVEEMPEAAGVLPTDMLKNQITSRITEEAVVAQVANSPGPFSLNGKTISTGTEEEYNTEQGIKMKRTYTVADKSKIQSSAIINMNADDMKKMVSGLVEKLLPNQSSNLMDMFGSLIGNLKIDASESADYTFQKDGWIKSITSESSYSSMGVSFQMNTKVTLK